MNKKYLALIMVILFSLTIFNGSIVADYNLHSISTTKDTSNVKDILEDVDEDIFDYIDDEDYSNLLEFMENDVNKISLTEQYFSAREILKDIDDDIKYCIENEDYNKLLKFMGNGSKLVKNAHINASGIGLYTVKKIKLLGWASPLPRLTRLGFFPPGLINAWLYYIIFNNKSHNFMGVQGPDENNKSVFSNATTFIEPENGDDPITIYGNHSILALVWQIMPLNKIWQLKRRLISWYNKINGLTGPNRTIATFPWSFEKWRFKMFWNYDIYSIPINMMFFTTQELMLMIMGWPFKFWMSFVNLIWPSSITGMAAFVIYKDLPD